MKKDIDRTFVADDKFYDVIIELKKRGWKKNSFVNFPGWSLKWRNYYKIQWKTIRPFQYVNHLQHSIELSNKSSFLFHMKFSKEYTNLSSHYYFPRCWDMNVQFDVLEFACYFIYYQCLFILNSSHSNNMKNETTRSLFNPITIALELIEAVIRSNEGSNDFQLNEIINMFCNEKYNILMNPSVNSSTLPCDFHKRHKVIQEFFIKQDLQYDFCHDNIWIIKPSGLSQGRNIQCCQDLVSILNTIQQLDQKCIVQKYIEKPLLIENYKFDIRQWVLITQEDPLIIYFYDQCYLRFSNQAFTTKDLNNKYIHLTNHSIQKDSTQKNPNGSMWSKDQFQDYLKYPEKENDIWTTQIVSQMKQIVVNTLLNVSTQLKRVGKGFEWLGYDFMIDANLKVWLIEVNVSPDVSHSTSITSSLLPSATSDLLELVLNETTSPVKKMGHWLLLYEGKRANIKEKQDRQEKKEKQRQQQKQYHLIENSLQEKFLDWFQSYKTIL